MCLPAAGKQRYYFFGNKRTRSKVHSIFRAHTYLPFMSMGKLLLLPGKNRSFRDLGYCDRPPMPCSTGSWCISRVSVRAVPCWFVPHNSVPQHRPCCGTRPWWPLTLHCINLLFFSFFLNDVSVGQKLKGQACQSQDCLLEESPLEIRQSSMSLGPGMT